MKMPLFLFIARAAVVAAISFVGMAGGAWAQDKPVRLVVPVPPGGALDMLARGLASRMSASGDAWIVENRAGADTMIGSEVVARAPADGRVILLAGATLVLAPLLRKMSYSPYADLRPVVQVSSSDFMLVVPADSPITSVRELASVAATRPEGLNCGAPPGPMALACAQLASRLARKVTAIPYPGIAPAVNAALGGHLDMLFVSAESVSRLVETGKLRALAVSSPAIAGKLPVFGQVWPGFLMEGYIGLFVPAATPSEDVKRLAGAVNRVLAEPAFAALMREAGQEPAGGTPEEFTARVERTRAHYAELIARLGLDPR
jgi:tripartite-type tricarboxylate transporter receptor subunit TctC